MVSRWRLAARCVVASCRRCPRVRVRGRRRETHHPGSRPTETCRARGRMPGRRSPRNRSSGFTSPGASACQGQGGDFGLLSSTPLMRDGVAYVQDTSSSVYAIDLRTGRRLWAQRRREPNDGPNGLALVGDRLYGASDTSAFALDASDGRRLWVTQLVSPTEQFINIAPVVDRGRVYVEHRRASARWPRGDLRARRGHGKAALEVRHDQGALAEPDRRRRRRLGAAERRCGRAGLRGHRQPGPVGRLAAVPERRLVPGADALHRLTRRPRRRRR